MKKIFTLLLAIMANVGMMYAERVKIGDLYYNLDPDNNTAEVTYEAGSSYYSNYPGLITIIIPESVEYNSGNYSVISIGSLAFQSCADLTSVNIPNSVTSIGNSAFRECINLLSVTIPNSVTSIGDLTFYKCTKLTSVTIPDSITSIGYSVFSECSSLTSITIPNSVTSIGQWAFSRCSSLASVTIPNSVRKIRDHAFYECTNLTSITIPDSVTSIEEYTFYKCTGLISVTIGNSVISISKNAFEGCTGLTSLTIGNSVNEIRWAAFSGCTGLTSITCEAVTPPMCGENVFYEVDKSIPLYVPAGSVEDYKAAGQWKYFYNIHAINEEAINEVIAAQEKVTKLIRNGQLLILTGDKTYTVTGQEVK